MAGKGVSGGFLLVPEHRLGEQDENSRDRYDRNQDGHEVGLVFVGGDSEIFTDQEAGEVGGRECRCTVIAVVGNGGYKLKFVAIDVIGFEIVLVHGSDAERQCDFDVAEIVSNGGIADIGYDDGSGESHGLLFIG